MPWRDSKLRECQSSLINVEDRPSHSNFDFFSIWFTSEEFETGRKMSVMGIFRCAVKRRWSTAGKKDPPGNWIAPPGSNWSGGGGNKAAGASDVEGRTRRLGESAGRNVSER